MIHIDRIYGKIKITEPVILDLVNCPAIQRLKGIDQGGYYEVHFPGTKNNRFEHSMGVFILLKKYDAPLEEQIAGLIHDVSHSAFSHCIDYVLAEGSQKEQSHQDNVFEKFVRKSEIPKILKKYGVDLDFILDDSNFPLKEKDLPDLCADRLDYSLRQTAIFNVSSNEEIQKLLDDLITEGKCWIFTNYKSAQKYADIFLSLNRIHYSGIQTAVMFRTVGDYLKYSINKGFIKKADLYLTDEIVLRKIKPFHKKDEKLSRLFRKMNNEIKYKNNPADFDTHVFCKSRIVDPLCKHKNKILRVSEINPEWKKIIKAESKPKQYFIKFAK